MNPTMNRRNYLKTALTMGGGLMLPAGVLALAGCSGTSREDELVNHDGRIMGTGYSVRIGKQAGVHVDPALGERIHAVLQDVDRHMSTWRSDSELSRFNASENGDWQPVSAHTSAVIAHAMHTSEISQGAFDATVEPLVSLWGFGAAGISTGGGRPQQSAISQTLGNIGFDSIDIDVATGAVRKAKASSQLDLSGIAKGHAVDRLAALLDAEGHQSYLVEVGGELRSRGRKPDGSAWRVAIEQPQVGRRGVYKVVELENRAIATSGDYRNFFDHQGTRYSHSIDPRNGQPVTHDMASVSVLADTTMQADALSTALMIMGPDDGLEFAEQHQIAAHMIVKEGSALAERQSAAFAALSS